MSCVLPLLDIRKWQRHPKAFAEELRQACHRVGFFTLRHDILAGLAKRMLSESSRFFSLPMKEKMGISYELSPAFRGYMALGKENTSGITDFREQVELASETGNVNPTAWPHYYKRLQASNSWPDSGLKECALEYVEHLERISESLTQALCLALQLEKNAFKPLFRDPFWQLKLTSVSLPDGTIGRASEEPGLFGVGAHTDTGFLTLLLQDDIGGLEVFTEEKWHCVPPAGPDVFVCNIGEVAEIASGGYLLATPHRVVMPDSVTTGSQRQRISVPYFYNPTLSARVETVDLPRSLPWERVNSEKHWRRKGNVMLNTYGENAFKSLARSHSSVFAKQHMDLDLLDDGRIIKKL